MSAANGGLDIDATWERLCRAWTAFHKESAPDAWLATHWASFGDDREWTMSLAHELRQRTEGVRHVSLALALKRLREFCEVERPLIRQAEWYRIARESLEKLVEALMQIDLSLRAGIFGYAHSALEARMDAFEWGTRRFPSVARALRGGPGRRASTLRDELVSVLADGGYGAMDIAELVIDPRGGEGARERIYQVTHARRAAKSKEEAP